MPHIENVARMLPVQRRNELAAIEFSVAKCRDLEIHAKQFLGAGHNASRNRWHQCAAENIVHFDLYLCIG